MPNQPASGNAPALSSDAWDEIHDALVIAHDALGKGPRDVDAAYLQNCCIHLRVALKRVHRAMEGRA